MIYPHRYPVFVFVESRQRLACGTLIVLFPETLDMKKILIAAAAGAAIYHLLNSEKGKEFMEQVKKSACDLGDQLVQKGKDAFGTVKDSVSAA